MTANAGSGARAPTWLLTTADGAPLRVRHQAIAGKTQSFLHAGALSAADLAVLDAAAGRFDVASDADAALAFAFALAAPRQGHIGVELTRLPERLRGERIRSQTPDGLPLDLTDGWPGDLQRWQRTLSEHSEVGSPEADANKPFIFQRRLGTDTGGDGLLMTNRMWRQQRLLADALLALATSKPAWVPPADGLAADLDTIYGPENPDTSEARAAASAVARGCLTVITGGPGTGKTWGLKRVLTILLQAAQREGVELAIELAAPTGKAAVRMAEAMAEGVSMPGVSTLVVDRLAQLQPRTVHKLLGVLPHMPHAFAHGKRKRLAADLVVVDEASMIDLVMMRHLVEAIADGKRLILLGDRDQLASVDAGTVLADIVRGAMPRSQQATQAIGAAPQAFADRIVRLTRSHRFKQAASVACVAEGLQISSATTLDDAVALLCGEPATQPAWRDRLDQDPHESADRPARLVWLTATAPSDPPATDALPESVLRELAGPYLDAAVDNLRHGDVRAAGPARYDPQPGYAALLIEHLRANRSLASPALHRELLDALARYRVLTAHRRGPRGVQGLNQWFSQHIHAALAAASTGGRLRKQGAHWLGQPVMITRNSYDVGLRNGDVGLVVAAPAGFDGTLAVAFVAPKTDPSEPEHPRYLPLSRLPEHETALAMTVHKSQGSQFERVGLVLPAATGSPILTRELIYTGITRAQWRVMWAGDRQVLREAVGRDVTRASGLSELLWSISSPKTVITTGDSQRKREIEGHRR